MTLSIFDRYITQTSSGETVPAALVTIYAEGGSLAPLYLDSGGVTPAGNPVTADPNGRVKVYILAGKYTAIASFGGDLVSYPDIEIGLGPDNIDLDVNGVDTTLSNYVDINNLESVSEMKSIGISAGLKAKTLGYYSSGDLGSAEYIIKTAQQAIDDGDTIDGYGNHFLSNGNAAVLMIDYAVNIRKFGAVGDGLVDDYDSIQSAIDTYSNSHIFIPRGKFKITNTLRIPWTYGLRISGEVSTSIDSPAPNQIGSTIYAVGCNGFELGNISINEKINNITFEYLSIVGDGVGPALPNGTLTTPPTSGTRGIISSGQDGFHGNFKFKDVHIEYFEEAMWTNLLGWVYMENCIIQNCYKGASIQANIVNISKCLFYQNGRIDQSLLDLDNFSGEYLESLTYGLFVRGTAIHLDTNDFEDNTIPVRIGFNENLGETELTMTAGYFESSQMLHVYCDNASVDMSSLLVNDPDSIKFYFNRSIVNLATTPNMQIVANRSTVTGIETCKNSHIDYINTTGYANPINWTAEYYIKSRVFKGYADTGPSTIEYQFMSNHAGTLLNATNTLVTGSLSRYLEPNYRRLEATSDGGSVEYTIHTVTGAEKDYAFTISFISSTQAIRVVLSTPSYIVDLDESNIEVDENGVATLQFIAKGITPSTVSKIIIFPGDSGDYIDILAMNWQVYEGGSPSNFLQLGDSMKRYGYSAPTSGDYIAGSTVTNRGYDTPEPHGWLYDGSAWIDLTI